MPTAVRPARRRGLALALACSLLAATVSAVQAAHASVPVLYVGGSTCSDAGSGTQTLPYCTIGAAAAVAVAGQTVQVAAGTYPEDVRPARSGTATAPIAFTAVPSGGAVVSGGTHAFDLSSRSYVTVTGFVSSGTTSSGLYLRSADHITLQQDIVTTAGLPAAGYTAYGIYLSATTNSLVRGNVTYGNSAAGVYLTAGSTGNTVDGNESYGNANGYQRAAAGIDVRSPGNVITHNRTHGNEDTGIQLYPGGDHNVVAGNVSYDNKGFTTTMESNCDRPLSGAAGCITGDHGIDNYATYGNVLTGNTVYGNVSAGINVEGDAATSTTAAVGASDTTLLVSSTNGFPTSGPYTVQVDKEQMNVVGGQGTTTWTVVRGVNGTTPAPHGVGCSGTGCSPKNLNVLTYSGAALANNVSVDNAISCPDGQGGLQTPCNRTKGEIRVDQYSWVGTTADRDLMWTGSTSYPYVATWGNTVYKTVAALATASGQEAHATQADPLFVNASQNDFRLSAGSPAIDAADSGAVGEPITDVLGNSRLDDPATVDTGTGPRSYDDRGAYEFQPSVRPAAPTLSVTAGDRQAQLTWTSGTATGAAPATQWDVYRGDPGAEALLVSLDGSRSDYLDTGLTDGASYTYYLVATNPAGQSPPSAEVTVVPVGPSPTPTTPSPTPTTPSPTPTTPSPTPPPPTTTPLSLYLTDTSSATLSGARKLVSSAPASETSHQTVFGNSTGWGPVFAGGTTQTWPAAAAEPGVNTHGFLADAVPLTGMTLPSGSYAPSVKVKVSTAGVTATFSLRVWLRHSNGTFSLLAKYVSGTRTLTTTAQVITAWTEAVQQPATPTSSGDLIFVDVVANILSNTAGSATNPFTFYLNGGSAESITTPGLTSTGGQSP